MADDPSVILAIVVALLLTIALEAIRSLRGRPLSRASALLTAVLLAFALDVVFAMVQRVFATAELPRYLAFAFLQGVLGWFLYRGLEREERDRSASRSASTHRQPAPQRPKGYDSLDWPNGEPRQRRGGPPMVSQARKALAEHPEWRLRGDVWDTLPATNERGEDARWMNDQPQMAQTRPNLSAMRSQVKRAPTQEAPQAWGDLPTLPYVSSYNRRLLEGERPAS